MANVTQWLSVDCWIILQVRCHHKFLEIQMRLIYYVFIKAIYSSLTRTISMSRLHVIEIGRENRLINVEPRLRSTVCFE